MAYRNPQIVHKFTEHWDVPFAEADDLFGETKRLLWLLHRTKGAFSVDPALTILDEMWHTFVLFTKPYTAYCQRVFGGYLHHLPATHATQVRMDAAWRRDPVAVQRARNRAELRRWTLVNDELGEATLLKWYVELPVRYSDRFFRDRGIALRHGFKPPPALVRRVRALRG